VPLSSLYPVARRVQPVPSKTALAESRKYQAQMSRRDEELIAARRRRGVLVHQSADGEPVVLHPTVRDRIWVQGLGAGEVDIRARPSKTKALPNAPRPGGPADQGAIVALGEESNAVAPAARRASSGPPPGRGGPRW